MIQDKLFFLQFKRQKYLLGIQVTLRNFTKIANNHWCNYHILLWKIYFLWWFDFMVYSYFIEL